MSARTKFYRDKANGKVMGICAGIADYTGFDVTLVRIGMVILTVAVSGTLIPIYFVAGMLAPKKPYDLYETAEIAAIARKLLVILNARLRDHYLYETPDDQRFWQGVRTNTRRTTAEVRSKFRELDRRLADIETHYTSRNTRLADEIEALR